MGRREYAPVFAGVGLLLLLPFFYVSYMQIRLSTQSIEFARKERLGIQFLEPVQQLLRLLVEHRTLSVAAARGQTDSTADLVGREQEIDHLLTRIDALDRKFGGPTQLRSRDAWYNIRSKWKRLESPRNPEVPDGAEDKLVHRVTALIRDQVANYSNLILDPNLNSYWLMFTYVVDLPGLADSLGLTTDLALTLQAEGASPGQRIDLSGLYQANLSDLKAIEEVNLKPAFADDEERVGSDELKRELEPGFQELKENTLAFESFIKKQYLSKNGVPRLEADEQLTKQSLIVLESLFSFTDQLGSSLDQILRRRVAQYERERSLGILGAGVTTVALITLFVVFYFYIQRSVRILQETQIQNEELVGELTAKNSRLLEQTQMREQLIGIVGHDLRSPLCAILVSANYLSIQKGEAENPWLARIHSSALRMADIIRDLVEFIPTQSGLVATVDPAPADVDQICHRVLQHVKIIHGGRTVHYDPQGNSRGIWDADRLEHIISNLVNNALVYSPKNSAVDLRWWRTGEDLRAGLVVQVRSESEMPLPEILEHISEQFRPGGQAQKTVNFRMGLELLIVRELVHDHGGELEIVFTPEFGTVAMVRLPSGLLVESRFHLNKRA